MKFQEREKKTRKMRFAHGMNEMRQTQANTHTHTQRGKGRQRERQKEKAQNRDENGS